MSEELNIDPEKNKIDLESNKSDHSAVALKAVFGTVPGVGSILSEVVSVVIPNQKVDRIKLFVEVLDAKVKYIEKDILDVKMKTEEFTDLFEDALPQAARALSDERREHIATFLKNSLINDDLTHIGEKKLLSLLNELNDAEIIFLKFEALDPEKQDEFYELHENVLAPIPAAINSPREEYERMFLHNSYEDKLLDLKLITPVFKRISKGETPEFDEKTGRIKSSYNQVSGIGRMLLRYIDDSFVEEED